MSARDARLLRAYLEANELTTVQMANLAGVTTTHCQAVLAGRAAPEPSLERLLATVNLPMVAKALAADEAPMAPVASIAPTSPIAAAMAEVQSALQAEADQSRDLARAVTEAAQRYASIVEAGIAHRMLAGVGLARGESAPDTQGAALRLLDAVQRIPELSELLDAPAPAAPAATRDPVLEPTPSRDREGPSDALAEPEPPRRSPPPADSPWPMLVLASRARHVLVVGGVPNAQTLTELRATGLTIEWCLAGSAGGERQHTALVARLRNGNATGLVFVKGCLRHKHANALAAAATAGGVPTSQAATNGRAAMTSALEEIESSLRGSPRRKVG